MTEPYDAFVAREAELNARFRELDARKLEDRDKITFQTAGDIPDHVERAAVRREKTSYKGIGGRKALKDLVAGGVDQAYLDEICTIEGLERLELSYPVTARSLDGLRMLKRLRHLKIDSPRNISDFSPLLDLPALRVVFIENAKHMADIEWLADARQLEVLGIEGGMWTRQKIPTLAPLASLGNLRAFFATSTRLGDKDLSPLAGCARLEYLNCAQFVPREEFERLRRLKPELVCTWFRPEIWDWLARNRS